jgi:hypothetical protein
MPTTITWGDNVTQVTQIAWPGVSHSFVGVNRRARVKLPAPPAVRVASTAHQLDEVRDEEGRDLNTPGKMSKQTSRVGGAPLGQPVADVVRVIGS